MAMKRYPVKSAVSLLACLALLLCCLGVPALAAVPQRPDNYYVLDEAGVLEESTEADMIQRDEALFQATGAEIVVVTVDFLGGEAIDDYAYELFEDWSIGSSQRNNGLLLLLAIGEDDYYAMPGVGVEDSFSGGTLQTMLDDYLEPDFAREDYDAGVRKFFDQAYAVLEAVTYDDSPSAVSQAESAGTLEPETASSQPQSQDYSHKTDKGGSFLKGLVRVLLWIIVIAVVLVLLFAVFRTLSRSRRSGAGGFFTGMALGRAASRPTRRGTPPPPPREPRTARPPAAPRSSYRDLGAYGQIPRTGAPRTGSGARPGGSPAPRSGSARSSGGYGSFGGSTRSSVGSRSSSRSGSGRSGTSRGSGGYTHGGSTRGGGAGRR